MRRRPFIKGMLTPLLVPGGVLAATAAIPGQASVASDWFFYDHRFPEALRLATSLAGPGQLTPVQGDITEIWAGHLRPAFQQAPTTVRGVTTESFHFCLRNMVRSVSNMESRVTRVDRDLHLWTIQSNHDQYGLTGI